MASLVGDVANIVNGVQQSDAEKQGAFTGQLVTAFRNRYPDYNVIVFHSQDSQYDFDDTEVHYHYELPISFGTYGYEVLVFQYGWYVLHHSRLFRCSCFWPGSNELVMVVSSSGDMLAATRLESMVTSNFILSVPVPDRRLSS